MTENQQSKIDCVEKAIARIKRAIAKQRNAVSNWTSSVEAYNKAYDDGATNGCDYYLHQAITSLDIAYHIVPKMIPARKKRVSKPGIEVGAAVRLKRGHDLFAIKDTEAAFTVLSLHDVQTGARVSRYAKITPVSEYDACKVPLCDITLFDTAKDAPFPFPRPTPDRDWVKLACDIGSEPRLEREASNVAKEFTPNEQAAKVSDDQTGLRMDITGDDVDALCNAAAVALADDDDDLFDDE